METAILESILKSFVDEVIMTERQLGVGYAFLFGKTDDLSLIDQPDIIDTLEYVKEIIDHYSIMTVYDLRDYFEKRKRRYDKFLCEAMENTEFTIEPVVMKAQVENADFHFQGQESFGHGTIINSEFNINKFGKTFQDYLERLSVYYKEVLGRSVRCTFSDYEEFTFNLDSYPSHNYPSLKMMPCLSAERRFKRYFKEFSDFDNFGEIIVWKTVPHRDMKISNMLFGDSACTNDLECTNATTDYAHLPDRIYTIYDHILQSIQLEQPIKDKTIKDEIVEWLCYSKFYSSGIKDFYADSQNAGEKTIAFCQCKYQPDFSSGNKRTILKTKSIYSTVLSLKIWKILKSPPGHTWLTSDNPGFGINLADLYNEESTVNADASLSHIWMDTVIYYPLSSNYCLRIQPDASISSNTSLLIESAIEFEQSTFQEFKVVNGLTFSTKNHVVIAKDKKTLEQLELI